MGFWKSKMDGTVADLAVSWRSHAEQIPTNIGYFVRETPLTFLDQIMLRRFASVIRCDAEASIGHSMLPQASRDALARILRDVELVTQVLDRKSVQWSAYQKEELLAIAERIGRSYRQAADGLTAAVS